MSPSWNERRSRLHIDMWQSRFVDAGFLFLYICVISSNCCIWLKLFDLKLCQFLGQKNSIFSNNLEKRSPTVILEHCEGWDSERPRPTVCVISKSKYRSTGIDGAWCNGDKHCSRNGKTWEFPLLRSRSNVRVCAPKPVWEFFYISTKEEKRRERNFLT